MPAGTKRLRLLVSVAGTKKYPRAGARTAVDAADGETVQVGPERLDDEAKGGRAGRRGVGRVSVLERRKDGLERLAIWVAVARVLQGHRGNAHAVQSALDRQEGAKTAETHDVASG